MPQTNPTLAFITKGSNTSGHGERLKRLGYTVTEESDRFVVETNGAVEGPVVLEDAAAVATFLKGLVENRQFLTYKTQVTLPGGVTRKSIMLCTALDKVQEGLSCLVMKPVKASSRPAGPAIFAGL